MCVTFPIAPARRSSSNFRLTGRNSRPSFGLDRSGAEQLVREAAERHRVDPALVRAVIETESNWNAAARSRKGAIGLMQLIPTTAQRFGANDAYSPQQNVDAGVRYPGPDPALTRRPTSAKDRSPALDGNKTPPFRARSLSFLVFSSTAR